MNPLTPYLVWIKAGAALAIALALVGFGWKYGSDRAAAKIERVRTDLVVCAADKNTLADALNQVNAKAEQAKRDAAAQATYAVEAVKQADKDRAKYETKLDSVEAALEKAKRAPVCRAQLEAPLCIDLD